MTDILIGRNERASVSAMGSALLGRELELDDTQQGVLGGIFGGKR